MTDEVKIDLGLHFGCTPPIVVPVSDRAKEKMCLYGDYDGALFLQDMATDVLAVLSEDDWIIGTLDTLPEGAIIKLMSIKVLH